MALANVTLNNTFDEWRTVTNQVITFVNDFELKSFAQLYSNTAVLTVTENVARGSKNYITLNVSSSVLDRSTLNVATANAVNIVFAALANTDARLVLVSNDANTINSVANAAIIHSNAAFSQANDAFLQANVARIHANLAFNQANTVYNLANVAFGNVNITIESNKAAFLTANLSYEQANTARDHANAAFLAANNAVTDYSPALIQANTARIHANVSFTQANTARDHANAAFSRANTGFSNTSGSSFAGNIQFPTGNIVIGEAAAQGIRLHVNASIGVANIFPQIKSVGGSQFINLNANTNFGGWNDLTLDRDLTIIYSKGGADDGANLVIGPWTDSSFGYKQDGQGRHGFNTSNPRYELDANGTANISGSLLVGAMNVVPTITAAMVHANAAFAQANTAITPRVLSLASNTSPLVWNSNTYDQICFTALANALTLNADSGSPVDGQKIIFRFKPSGTQTLTWTTGATNAFRALGITLPTSLTSAKTVYVGCVYNATDLRWDAVAVSVEP